MKPIFLETNKKMVFNSLVESFTRLGYERESGSLRPGSFSISGGNIIIFPVNFSVEYRIEFFGDTIDAIFTFDKKINKIIKHKEVTIVPNLLELENHGVIKPRSCIVHEDHGVGVFSNLETKKILEKNELYAVIKYLNDDTLYVPIDLVSKISPYIGVGRKKPRLNRLGSQTWQKTYKKTYENIILMAKELLQIYANREITKRGELKIDDDWNREISRTFGYTDTKDQTKAIGDVFSDLARDVPMDRLVCGDVGFGKTEVAIRAAAQFVANGYQVALLAPTTILAEQHFLTLSQRFKKLPVQIERLSRFIAKDGQEKTVSDVANGSIDIVVGTHRLFSKDIKFKNLGLLIVDEEQKFGVKDKEKIKKMKLNVDVLSLTATPIPRTLFMSLSGIRDLSQISTPPSGRKEIDTSISIYDDNLVHQFIEREFQRGGQIYYLHNEVKTIVGAKNRLSKMFPKNSAEVAHGQMGEKALANVMSKFASGKIDILVCSTIVENGLDLPNVNTLIVDEADKFGLSQMYQIRGRIGRSPRESYALFTYRNKKISDNALKRLRSLAENTELGSGFNIALSDLEIRGGGNILGREQHGNMEAIGLVLYSKLLSRAVEKLKSRR